MWFSAKQLYNKVNEPENMSPQQRVEMTELGVGGILDRTRLLGGAHISVSSSLGTSGLNLGCESQEGENSAWIYTCLGAVW